MRFCLIFGCLVILLCAVVCTAEDWSKFPNHDIYPVADKRFCAFPFTFQGRTYNDCTLADGSKGNVPWCSLTSDYYGYMKLCYDFRSSTLQCLPSWSVRTGSTMTTYTQCTIFANNSPYYQCKTDNSTFMFIYCVNNITKRIDKSYTDRVTCDPKYSALSAYHTTCYGPSEYCIQVPLNSSERQAMMDLHNKYRADVPDAANMFKVYWDDELSKLAQAHSARGALDSDLAVNRLTPKFGWKNGQNLVIALGVRFPAQIAFDFMFSDERNRFAYGYGCTSNSSTCLHYTLLILDLITLVGCGRSICVYPDHAETVITCNYLYSQYSDGYKTPYKKSSTPASACGTKFRRGNLCDCGPVACNNDNGEILDPNTCTCKCACTKSLKKRSISEREDDSDEVSDYDIKGFRIDANGEPILDE